jgi:hypothetical protein
LDGKIDGSTISVFPIAQVPPMKKKRKLRGQKIKVLNHRRQKGI